MLLFWRRLVGAAFCQHVFVFFPCSHIPLINLPSLRWHICVPSVYIPSSSSVALFLLFCRSTSFPFFFPTPDSVGTREGVIQKNLSGLLPVRDLRLDPSLMYSLPLLALSPNLLVVCIFLSVAYFLAKVRCSWARPGQVFFFGLFWNRSRSHTVSPEQRAFHNPHRSFFMGKKKKTEFSFTSFSFCWKWGITHLIYHFKAAVCKSIIISQPKTTNHSQKEGLIAVN